MRPRKPGILAALITVTLALPAQGLPSPCVQLEATLENPTMTIVGADWVAELHTVCYRTPDTPDTPDDHPPTYRGIGGNTEQWRPLVQAWFPADQVDTALAVMACESGGNPDAKNPGSTARGLMQILASLWTPVLNISYNDLYNPETNMWAARVVWERQGWAAWTAWRRGCR